MTMPTSDQVVTAVVRRRVRPERRDNCEQWPQRLHAVAVASTLVRHVHGRADITEELDDRARASLSARLREVIVSLLRARQRRLSRTPVVSIELYGKFRRQAPRPWVAA
jgi:hypothetical protein